jgi:hypothetical protein
MKGAAAVSGQSRCLFRRGNFDVVARQFPAAPFGAVGVTNPVLGVVGVAGIRTIVGPVHAAVPFGAERLVICRPCFRLIGEHGWHRWRILVGHALTRDARSVAAMVEGAAVALRRGDAGTRTLAVSRQ